MLGGTILSAKELLKKNSEKIFAFGTVSGTVSGFEGGHPKKLSNFGVTAFVIMPTAYQNAKTDIQKVQFRWGSMPPDPLLYYAPKGNSIPLKCKKA